MKKVNHKAQTALELALFGSVLIFVLVSIVRQTLNFGYQQNQSLAAMRMAMTMSFEHSEGLRSTDFSPSAPNANPKPGDGNSSRNLATVFLVEDRLSIGSGKYAQTDRIPLVSFGSATHSRNLFLPFDPNEPFNIPRVDVFVNGQHFPMTTAAFTKVCVLPTAAQCNALGQPYDKHVSVWDSSCAGGVGCAAFYTAVYNVNAEINAGNKWCDDVGSCSSIGNMSVDERFDLDRDGITDVPNTPASLRQQFSWQWFRIWGIDASKSSGLTITGGGTINVESSTNISVDLDGDFKEERIMKILSTSAQGVIQIVEVLDSQDGDVDFTHNDSDPTDPPGFNNDLDLYATTGDGTHLLVQQGKLFTTDTRQFVRSVQKKDTVDIVTRPFTMSNNTGRFCDAGMTTPTTYVDEVLNPVEVCCSSNGCCSETTAIVTAANPSGLPNQLTTCFEQSNTGKYTMYMRSRISDKRGRKWITDVMEDGYIDYQAPSK